MKELLAKLLSLERLDLHGLLVRYPHELRELLVLREFPWGDESLLDHAKRTMDAVLEAPPPDSVPPPGEAPWWSPLPALHLAALFQHAGLPAAAGMGASSGHGTPPHERTSALICRRVLRRIGIPFTVREHSVALVLHSKKPDDLVGSDAPAETYMKLACRLDLRSLYALRLAELRADGVAERGDSKQGLASFRKRCEELSVFCSPPRPPLTAGQIRDAAPVDEGRARRIANALRYFRLCQQFTDRKWFARRACEEAGMVEGQLNLLIGIAGCGKSTWAAANMADTEIVSSDAMRLHISGDESDQSHNYRVFQEAMRRTASVLREGGTVTLDATNYSEELRGKPLATARWAGARICAFFFDLSLSDALQRNLKRERRVPEHVIARQWRMLTPPALYEADEHYVVDRKGRAKQWIFCVMPEFGTE